MHKKCCKLVDLVPSCRFLTIVCLVLMTVAYGSTQESQQSTSSPSSPDSITPQRKIELLNSINNKSIPPASSNLSAIGNQSNVNETNVNFSGSMSNFIPNKAALIRSIYVFGGLCFLAVLYFIFRTWRLRRRRGSASRRTGTRKYRPLNAGAGSQEMEPLGAGDNEDEDEDTLFDNAQPNARPIP